MNKKKKTRVKSISKTPPILGDTLRSEGLFKRYKKRFVVKNVTIDVRQGECVGLLTERRRKDNDILYDDRNDRTD